tara:strand:- start:10837 stop:12252 length:1416 start_codon:yes stop_codon:yes gene_type:complete
LIFGSYFLFGEGFNEWYVFSCSVISVVHMLIFDVTTRYHFKAKGLFSVSTLFFFSYAIVFFQFPILAPFYEEIRFNSLLWMREDFVNWTTMISAGSIHLFMVGYLHVFLRKKSSGAVEVVAVANRQRLRILLFVFPGASLFCFGLFLSVVGPSYLSGAYGGSANWGGGATYFFRLFEVFFYLTVALEIYKIKITKHKVGFIEYFLSFNFHTSFFIAFFLLFNLFTGDRGSILSTVIMLVGGYDFFFKRLPFLLSVVTITCGVLMLAFISDYRTQDASMTIEERINQGKLRTEDKQFYEITGDLAASVRIMNYAVMITPNLSDFYYGWVQFGRVAGAVPLASGVFNKVLPVRIHDTPLGSTSSSIFTYHVLGPNSKIGVGSSIIADLYIDFGIIGCFVGMALFGYFIAWVETRADGSVGLFKVVFYLLVVAQAVYWPRSFIGIAFQQWALAMGILYLIFKYYLGKQYIKELA